MNKIKTTAIALSAIVLFATSSSAAPTSTTDSAVVNTPTAEPVSIEYLGEDTDYRIFRVVVTPGSNKNVTFSVSDFNEGEIYAAKFSTEKIQTLKIEKRMDQNLDFIVSAGGKTYTRSFTIMPTVVLK
ncbi:MAG TPA: hypothetical protein PKC39_07670 [Ferruginibacter sp.]|nr:hypothetical protein [Ferruginibacter sp.]HMP20822.1 hypothetical protein [Ferruginibacter sp.]